MTEESIFEAALKRRSSVERSAYLDEVCACDAELRRRVEARLQVQEETGTLAEPPGEANSGDHGMTEAAHTAAPAENECDPSQAFTTARKTQGYDAGEGGPALDFLGPATKPGTLGRLGHYEVTNLIGRGGMGVVLRAFDEKLHRVVAIKTMALELAASATARKRFIREAQAAAAVCHEHIVTIHAVEEDHRPPYLVMQYIEGCSLQDKLNQSGPLELRQILRIGMQTAAGLAAAHKQGLVHRDIKPANILLEDNVERVKITDFGLARATDDASLTQSGVIAGTPQYMSPEQAEAKPVDHRSDLFSLGSVLYALCTGRAPFRANSTVAILRRVCDDTPRPIREVNSDIPEWLCDITARLHAKEPSERFQSAAEVAELLGDCLARFQQGVPVPENNTRREAIALPSGQGNTAAIRSRRLAVAIFCVSLVLSTGFFILVLWLFTRGTSSGLPWDPKPPARSDSSPDAKSETPLSPAEDLLKDALLVMDFEKDSFYEKDGKTYVRDRSGHGNDGLCENVAFTPEGKAGGGLACNGGYLRLRQSLINRLPNYTITAWVRRVSNDPDLKDGCLYARALKDLDGSNYTLWIDGRGGVGVNAWNRDYLPNNWNGAVLRTGIAAERWVFITATLRDGGIGKGALRLTIDDRVYNLNLQMVDGDEDDRFFDYVGVTLKAVLDEVTVFPRALSDEEIQSIRGAGKDGKPLSVAKLRTIKPPWSPGSDPLKDALLVMDFEKDSFYEKDGKTYVRDRSGHGNDGLCENVAFTPEGKAGGGLACNGGYLRLNRSLINHLPNYTITAWVRRASDEPEPKDGDLYKRAFEQLKEPTYVIWIDRQGGLGVNAWNQHFQPDSWFNADPQSKIPEGQWTFVAATLHEGHIGKGGMRFRVNDRLLNLKSQMVGSPTEDGVFDYLGATSKITLDEVTVFPRALSDAEVQAIRRRGIEGEPLGTK
jgi:serine/threonine protein kinase